MPQRLSCLQDLTQLLGGCSEKLIPALAPGPPGCSELALGISAEKFSPSLATEPELSVSAVKCIPPLTPGGTSTCSTVPLVKRTSTRSPGPTPMGHCTFTRSGLCKSLQSVEVLSLLLRAPMQHMHMRRAHRQTMKIVTTPVASKMICCFLVGLVTIAFMPDGHDAGWCGPVCSGAAELSGTPACASAGFVSDSWTAGGCTMCGCFAMWKSGCGAM